RPAGPLPRLRRDGSNAMSALPRSGAVGDRTPPGSADEFERPAKRFGEHKFAHFLRFAFTWARLLLKMERPTNDGETAPGASYASLRFCQPAGAMALLGAGHAFFFWSLSSPCCRGRLARRSRPRPSRQSRRTICRG